MLPLGGEEVGGNSQEFPGGILQRHCLEEAAPSPPNLAGAGAAGPRLDASAVLHPGPGRALPDDVLSLFCLRDQRDSP